MYKFWTLINNIYIITKYYLLYNLCALITLLPICIKAIINSYAFQSKMLLVQMLSPLWNHYPVLTNIKTRSIMFNLYLDTLTPAPSFWGNPRKITFLFSLFVRFLYLLIILLNFYFVNSILGLLKVFLDLYVFLF